MFLVALSTTAMVLPSFICNGVRQGCPLSGILFVLGIGLFARALKNKASVKGIRVDDHEIKIAQYADDTTVFVRDKESVLELLDFLKEFSRLYTV